MEPILEIVYGRDERGDPVRDAAMLQRTLNHPRGASLVRRGVYRFARHEEADSG